MLRYANPKRFLDLSATLLPFLWILAIGLLGWGLYQAIFVVPPSIGAWAWIAASAAIHALYLHAVLL